MDNIDYVIHEHPLASGQQWVESVVRVANTRALTTVIRLVRSAGSRAQIASFPGLHAQLLSLAVQKAGEDLDGLIT